MREIKDKLEKLYNSFDFDSAVQSDPIKFPKKYTNRLDIEISGIIASAFAYGNIKCFCNFLEELFKIMGQNPSEFILNFDLSLILKKLRIKYRFSSVHDIVAFLFILQKMLQNSPSKSLEHYFSPENNSSHSFFHPDYSSGHLDLSPCHLDSSSCNFIPSSCHSDSFLCHSERSEESLELILKISNFVQSALKIDLTPVYGKNIKTRGLLHFFPDPLKGSPCKRINLFLRWMVRKRDIDFALWNTIKPSELIIPLDVHIWRVSKKLGFTKRNTQSIKTAMEITEYLKKIEPEDPLKYDFVLCHGDINSLI
ncbi:DUF2400 domain-containing protein [Thermodesulfovibrio yellowstonii]|uniref:TIGR02757 family protein n=1 Tax=Thermodesulfovibrio yellowstonii TaxID=28262 RepID=A0A9W6GFW2_9BACT|nr:DUF2400 domain-containing protein [Thermodesulfovibrio islandicus]GLI53410.1 TIGR02757 family protein [Thermodesulfovibrio islandicus]